MRSMIDPSEVVQRYIQACNQHDSAAILAAFAEDGTYSDPSSGRLVTGEAIKQACDHFFAAFPDLFCELDEFIHAGDGKIALQLRVRGTNTGSFRGKPPTGNTINLPVALFLVIEDDRIRTVQGYVDQHILATQLGFQVVVQPFAQGSLRFGTAVQMQTGGHVRPGAFSITWIEANSAENIQKVHEYSFLILRKMATMPGFIGYTGVTVGNRLCTISAWRDPEAARALLQERTHVKAMRQFFEDDIGNAGYTSVWTLHHANPLRVRCPACTQQVAYELQESGRCQCGAVLPEPPPYW